MKQQYSQYTGVTFDKRRNKWIANIKIHGKNKFLGYFEDEYSAYQKRLQAENDFSDEYLSYSQDKAILHENILNDYKKGLTQAELAKKYNKDPSTICELLHKQNITIRDDKTINIDINCLIKDYKKTPNLELLAEKYNATGPTLSSRLKEQGIKVKIRQYEFFDENFLNIIDESWKAYFMGLFWADGNMRKLKDNSKSAHLRISLQEKDKHVLEQLNKKIFKNNTIKLIEKGLTKFPNGKYYQPKNQYKLEIHSILIHNALLKYGCHPNKSLTIEYPQNFPDNMFWDFLRGYFDGDGWIQKSNFGLIGSDIFCKQIYDILTQKYNLTCYIRKAGKVSRLFVHKKGHLKIIFDNMYTDNEIYLKRKYNKFKSII